MALISCAVNASDLMRLILIIIIIIISIFKEDNVFSMTANLPHGPPVNTDIDYYRTFFGLFYLLREEKPVLAL